MALQQGRIGSIPDAIQYDDADYDTAMEVDNPIRVNAEPVDAKDVLRLEDIGSCNLSNQLRLHISSLYQS